MNRRQTVVAFTLVGLGILAIAAFASYTWRSNSSAPLVGAPLYAPDFLDATTVEWQIVSQQEVANQPTLKAEVRGESLVMMAGRINTGVWVTCQLPESGDSNHRYEVQLYLVSRTGKVFLAAQGPDKLHKVRTLGLISPGDLRRPKMQQVDWESARFWCEVRISDDDGRVCFHGVKQSDPLPLEELEEFID